MRVECYSADVAVILEPLLPDKLVDLFQLLEVVPQAVMKKDLQGASSHFVEIGRNSPARFITGQAHYEQGVRSCLDGWKEREGLGE